MAQCCSGSNGSWNGRRRGSWVGRSEIRSEDEWFFQKCSTGNWWSRTDCRHCSSVTNEAAGPPQTSIQEKVTILENTLVGMGNEEPLLAGRRLLEKGARAAPEEAQWPEECGEAHRDRAELDQQGDQAHRGRGREVGGDACKHQGTEGNAERGIRGNQETLSGSCAGGRIDGQEQEQCPVSGEFGGSTRPRTTGTFLQKGNRFETYGWSIKRRYNGGDCQLVSGSGPNPVGDFSKKRKIHQQRHQDVRRGHGRIGWLSVIVKVQA